MTRRRQRRNIDPALNPRHLLLGALAILIALGLLYVSVRAQNGIPGRSYYEVRAQIDGVRILPPRGSDVRIAGHRVGETGDARLERGVATLTLRLNPGAGPLPADTAVRLRAKGLLGAQYLDVRPGHDARTLPAGSVIPPARTSTATTLDDVLEVLDEPRRSALRETIRGLGGGIAGHGRALNEALAAVKGFDDLRLLVRPLLDRPGTTSRLIRTAERLTAELSPVRAELAGGFAPIEQAIRPLADERAGVTRLLAIAPGALEGARQGLAGSDPLLARTERFSRAATAFTRDAPSALDAVARLLRAGRQPLRQARGILVLAGQAVPPTLRLTGALSPALPRLRSVLELARHPSRELSRYTCDIGRFGRTWRSFLGYAPRGQSGPLGPLTMLRVTLAGSGGTPGGPKPGTGVSGDIQPCEPIAKRVP